MENKRSRNNYYSLEDRLTIEKYLKMGKKQAEIAEILDRSRISITREIKRTGRSADYDAQKAHTIAQTNLKERNSRGGRAPRKTDRGPTKYHGDRIASLEMQVKILFEQVKRLTDGG